MLFVRKLDIKIGSFLLDQIYEAAQLCKNERQIKVILLRLEFQSVFLNLFMGPLYGGVIALFCCFMSRLSLYKLFYETKQSKIKAKTYLRKEIKIYTVELLLCHKNKVLSRTFFYEQRKLFRSRPMRSLKLGKFSTFNFTLYMSICFFAFLNFVVC